MHVSLYSPSCLSVCMCLHADWCVIGRNVVVRLFCSAYLSKGVTSVYCYKPWTSEPAISMLAVWEKWPPVFKETGLTINDQIKQTELNWNLFSEQFSQKINLLLPPSFLHTWWCLLQYDWPLWDFLTVSISTAITDYCIIWISWS